MSAGAPSFSARFRAEFETLLGWRRDVRHFRADPLPEGAIEKLLRLAALAPSVGNAQPWRFVRLRSRDIRNRLVAHVDAETKRAGSGYAAEQARLYASLKLHGLREAPELLAVFSDSAPEAGHGLGRATMPETLDYSTVMAIHTLWLAARAEGIGLGWVSILDPGFIAELLETPPQWRFVALLCLGYPEILSNIPELERRGWQARENWSLTLYER